MHSLSVWVTLALAAFVAAVPSKDGVHKVRESIPSPRGWTKTKRAPADHIIELRIALPVPFPFAFALLLSTTPPPSTRRRRLRRP